jgi:hypothetical protein
MLNRSDKSRMFKLRKLLSDRRKPRLTQLQRDIEAVEAENERRHCECSSSDYLCLWCRASVRDTGKL